jgi:uncharacterized protein YjbI with pentapeptide repeats
MADKEHLRILKQGVKVWNQWRQEDPNIRPYLNGADLRGIDFSLQDPVSLEHPHSGKFFRNMLRQRYYAPRALGVDFHEVELNGARLNEANLFRANLTSAMLDRAHLTGANLSEARLDKAHLTDAILAGADLTKASLNFAHLGGANLREANLRKASLDKADLTQADLTGANLQRANADSATIFNATLAYADLTNASLYDVTLSEADLSHARLIRTSLKRARLIGCNVYATAVWDVDLDGAVQSGLVITPSLTETRVTAESLKIAQFLYLLLNNPEIRDIIDTLTTKVVLILGRFTEERKTVLDGIRESLRRRDYVPVMFDFDKPASKDVTGTVETLARMARFIIADLTDPSSIPHELATIIPHLRSTPVQPLRLKGADGYSMFDDFKVYPWVLAVHQYESGENLIAGLDQVLAPAEQKVRELRAKVASSDAT